MPNYHVWKQRQLTQHLVAKRARAGVCVCVCVCVKPCYQGYYHANAGALGTPWQTQCNEAMPWSGKQFGTLSCVPAGWPPEASKISKRWPPEAARLEGCGRFTGHVQSCQWLRAVLCRHVWSQLSCTVQRQDAKISLEAR